MSDTPVYSIIIPHYNIPGLLMRCLDSIPVREDVQVIVVDDNSPEADTYQERYPSLSRPYLEFYRATKGGGAGYARNIGINLSKGEWLIFADADDYFVGNLSTILDTHKDDTADIIFFRSLCVMSDDTSKPSDRIGFLEAYIDQAIKTGDINLLRYQHIVPWGKLYRRSLILSNSIRFEEIPYSNDIVFCTLAGCKAKSIQISESYLYINTWRQNSLTDNFLLKPGELEVRSKACFRQYRIIYESGYAPTGRLPISDFLLQLFYRNKNLYDVLLMRLSEIGCSKWTILRQIRGWVSGPWNKTWLYLYSVFISPLHYLIIQGRTRFDDLS